MTDNKTLCMDAAGETGEVVLRCAEGGAPRTLQSCAEALIQAGHDFWKACRRDAGGGAVRWLNVTDGTTIIFTRGEYADRLLKTIGDDYHAPEIVFKHADPDDEERHVIAKVAAPQASSKGGEAVDALREFVALKPLAYGAVGTRDVDIALWHKAHAAAERFLAAKDGAAGQEKQPGAWQPLASAPDGVRVLLGPREAPVVGIVRQMPEWADEQEPVAAVIHYNGATLVAGYHCSEWHPLPLAAPSAAIAAREQGAINTARLAWLHTANKDAEGYEYGVCKVKYDEAGKLVSCLWTAGDSSDVDAAMSAADRPSKEWYAAKIAETLDDDFAIGKAALASREEAPAAPQQSASTKGPQARQWPKTATPEMVAAFKHRFKEGSFFKQRLEGAIEAMLDAAPAPSPQAETGEAS
ncbi:hypothetical protein [Variovorax sp. PAMC26660]|uniref:hypothetical protein n=1 Tax=Variovorax sp. PAMC26660 TaxID=2762322 RepID=UPI00164E340D|nr:hypothetical protein [Variovorax sp. PAMC26660]QNK65880.1 hypothetical protein H7F35_22035 [Variovorax sp. PAMC26660]